MHRERDDGIDHPVKWLRNEPAQGLSSARNRGIEAAEGDVVTFLDDDDLLPENALEVIAQQFQQDQGLECLFINIDPFGAAGNGMRQNQAQTLNALLARMELSGHTEEVLSLGQNLFEALLDGLPLAFQRVAIRRSALQRVGLYQPVRSAILNGTFAWPCVVDVRSCAPPVSGALRRPKLFHPR